MTIDFDELMNERRQRQWRRGGWWWVWIVVLFVVLAGAGAMIELITEWYWFASLDRTDVFRTRLLAPLGLFALTSVLLFVWFVLNWAWAGRRISDTARWPGQRAPGGKLPSGRGLVFTFAAALAVMTAASVAAQWETVLLYLNRSSFGRTEPILGRDAAFYVFELPFYKLLLSASVSAVIVALVGAVILYMLGGLLGLRFRSGEQPVQQLREGAVSLPGRVRTHLWLLAALTALLWAAGEWLARFDLLRVARPGGPFYGPGFADVTTRIPAHGALAVVGALVAVLFLLTLRGGRIWLPIGGIVLLVILRAGLLGLWPTLVQRLRVDPNELNFEREYIVHNIELTRAAFGLDDVAEVEYEPSPSVTRELIAEHSVSLDNVRLWDWRTLLDTFRQLQEIRPYYDFLDVDIDRYEVAGAQRQVELSARELTPTELSNPTWVNRHLEFTHGFGAVVAPVDEVDPSGLPVLWVRDIPPTTSPPFELEISQPRVYFGEAPGDGYVIVNTETEEFDYPVGAQNVRTTYAGADGVRLSSWLRRLLFAMRYGDSEIFFSSAIDADSRILMHRNIRERARRLAPFLTFDPDPYLVVTDEGRLVWVYDAYTTSERYPYSQPVRAAELEFGGSGATGLGGRNYIRNSVKLVVDAYDGTATYYVVDDEDPIIRAWIGIFPSLFEVGSNAPMSLVEHWRYPEALFRAQAVTFRRYHMADPDTFYNAEDLWAIPTETMERADTVAMQPYYVTMRLRGEQDPEFLLMLPYTPERKQNMIAWLAARSDPQHYGELVVYRFAKGEIVLGPQQIESRIDQDTTISAQLTLWSQSGSRAIRGNLLVFPIGDSIVYVEPLYLQAETSALPELKRVIVASMEKVVMEETLDEAVAALIAAQTEVALETTEGEPAPPSEGAGGEEPAAESVDIVVVAAQALEHEREARNAAQEGDWARFGREMAALTRALERLAELTDLEPPAAATPTPEVTP